MQLEKALVTVRVHRHLLLALSVSLTSKNIFFVAHLRQNIYRPILSVERNMQSVILPATNLILCERCLCALGCTICFEQNDISRLVCVAV